MLRLLGAAGCVSIEAGIESLTAEGREALAKRCRLETEDLACLLIEARRHVPFVQANLIGVDQDDPALVEYWRDRLIAKGVWANAPVPLYPYPSSPSYRAMWGEPDDVAWERAHAHYLHTFAAFSDIQDERPVPLAGPGGIMLRRPLTPTARADYAGCGRAASGATHSMWRAALKRTASHACWSASGPNRTRAPAGGRRCGNAELVWTARAARLDGHGRRRAGSRGGKTGGPCTRLERRPAAPEPAVAGGRFARPIVPMVVASHSCVPTWWEAVRGTELPAAMGVAASNATDGLPAGGRDSWFPVKATALRCGSLWTAAAAACGPQRARRSRRHASPRSHSSCPSAAGGTRARTARVLDAAAQSLAMASRAGGAAARARRASRCTFTMSGRWARWRTQMSWR